MEFIYPLERRGIDRGYVGLGIGVYDVLGAGKGVPSHHKHLSKKKTLESFPAARRDHIQGGIKFYEGQLDDARHTMMIARTAAAYGAHVATSARVVGLLRDGERVIGATVRDLETGNEIRVRAKRTVNATGVWTDDIQKMIGGKGSVPGAGLQGRAHRDARGTGSSRKTGLITETEKSLLFIIPCPWSDDFWVIGTTDTPWDLDLAHPAASRSDIDYILEHANALLAKPLTRDDVVGVYAGLRPLLAGESDQTSKLSREHAVVSPVPGLVIVAGGKYTTYRVMAEDAINEAVKDLPGKVDEVVHRRGAADRRGRVQAAVEQPGRNSPRATGHRRRRGWSTCSAGTAARSTSCWALIEAEPELAQPLSTARRKYLKVEARYAVSHEGALHLDDILARRTRISIDTWDRGEAAAQEVAELVAPVLGWDAAAVDREVEHYRTRVAAERDSQQPGPTIEPPTRPGSAPRTSGWAPADDSDSALRHELSGHLFVMLTNGRNRA